MFNPHFVRLKSPDHQNNRVFLIRPPGSSIADILTGSLSGTGSTGQRSALWQLEILYKWRFMIMGKYGEIMYL